MAAIAAKASRLARMGFTYSFSTPYPQCRVGKSDRRVFELPQWSDAADIDRSNAAHQVLRLPDGALVIAVTADNLPVFASSGFT